MRDQGGIICKTYQLLKCLQILQICIFQGHKVIIFKKFKFKIKKKDKILKNSKFKKKLC